MTLRVIIIQLHNSLPEGSCYEPLPDVSCQLSCKCVVARNSFGNSCICLLAAKERKEERKNGQMNEHWLTYGHAEV